MFLFFVFRVWVFWEFKGFLLDRLRELSTKVYGKDIVGDIGMLLMYVSEYEW